MSTIRMGGGPGGTVQGQYGTYVPSTADGFYTVDVRDVPQMLASGMTFLRQATEYHTITNARAASAGRIVASAALSNGNLTIANQPDFSRQLNIIMGNGTAPITAGTVSVTYVGSDNVSRTEVFQAQLAPASGSITLPLSRPAVSISTPVVGGMAGGTSPWVRIDDTNFMGLPADQNANGFTVAAEWDNNARQTAPGTLQTGCIGAVSVVNTPASTWAYTFQYGFLAPLV